MPGLPEPGADWAGYHIEEQLATGVAARVYVAWDRDLERRVAIKVLAEPAGADAAERFRHDCRAAAGLDHPRIVPIHRVGEHDGVPFAVMRFVSGGDLGAEIHLAPLTLDRTASVIGQVGAALDHAHRAGLVHGAMSPAAVLCTEDADDVYLAGFGGVGAGRSVDHAAPETIEHGERTPATDIYGLGCVLFECLTGRIPFPAPRPALVADQHLESPPPRITDLRPDLPDELDGIVARAMAKDPGDRYPTARALAEAVALVEVPDTPTTGAVSLAGLVPFADGPSLDDPPATEPVEVAPEPGVSRSVFDEPYTDPSTPTEGPTEVAPAAGDGWVVADPREDGVVDGAAFGVYEDEDPPNRTPLVVASVLVLAMLVVGALVWRAVNTDAELASTTSTTAPSVEDLDMTVEALQTLVPDGIDTCVAPAAAADDADTPAEGPVVLQCPLESGVPDSLMLQLFASEAERDRAFDEQVAALEVSDRDDAECALGRTGRHPYEAEGHGGVVGCQAVAGQVDFVWARDDVPVLLHSAGGGSYVAQVQAWNDLAGRTDADFPLPEEQELLDALPDELLDDCRRDLELALQSGGSVAAACTPTDAEPDVVSWTRFTDESTMDAWIDDRRDSLENTFDTSGDGCTPEGFGEADPPSGDEGETTPDAAFEDYELDGTSGRVLCFRNTSGQNVLFWTRDGPRIGSIAVSDPAAGAPMEDLLAWWRDGGHRP